MTTDQHAGYLLVGLGIAILDITVIAVVLRDRKATRAEQLQVRHDENAKTLAHIARERAADDDLHRAPGLLDYRIGAGRRELAADPVANVVAGPWRARVVPEQRDGGAS